MFGFSLEELKLDRNELSEISEAISYLPKLLHLQLSENKINKLPEFLKMRTITTLTVSTLEDLDNGLFNIIKFSFAGLYRFC